MWAVFRIARDTGTLGVVEQFKASKTMLLLCSLPRVERASIATLIFWEWRAPCSFEDTTRALGLDRSGFLTAISCGSSRAIFVWMSRCLRWESRGEKLNGWRRHRAGKGGR